MAYDPSSRKCLVLFVGSSGAGKSTTINLLTDEKCEVADRGSTTSCTKETKVVPFKSTDDLLAVDTRGAQDTDADSTDKEIMAAVFRELNKRCLTGSVNLRVVFCVKFDDKTTPVLQQQCKFIDSLCRGKVWKSTLMICKEGKASQLLDHGIFGPEMSKVVGVDMKEELRSRMVLTRLDLVTKDDSASKLAAKNTASENAEEGYLRLDEAAATILKLIRGLPTVTLSLKRQRCSKCDARGDSRGFPEACHASLRGRPIKRHSRSLSSKCYHPGKVSLCHYGHEIQGSDVYRWYHPGSHSCAADRNPVKTVLGHVFTFGISTGITAMSGGFNDRWTCCKKEGFSSTGCQQEFVSKGLVTWSCCRKEKDSTGCTELYSCCKGPTTSLGCREKCSFECCGGAASSDGCQAVCSKCQRAWGVTGGCQKGEPHDIQDAA